MLSLGQGTAFTEEGFWFGCSAAVVCLEYLQGNFASGSQK